MVLSDDSGTNQIKANLLDTALFHGLGKVYDITLL